MKIVLWAFLLFIGGCLSPSETAAKIQLTVEEVPVQISPDNAFSTKVTLSGTQPDTPYYIRGAFSLKETTKYFGLTQNHENEWKRYEDVYTDFYKVQGDGSYIINFQIDKSSPQFSQSASEYYFKVGRYTEGGSHIWADCENCGEDLSI